MLAGVLVAMSLGASPLVPITIYDTGICGGSLCAFGATDPHYLFTLRADGGPTGAGSAVTEPAFVGPVVSYAPADGLSEWLEPSGHPAGAFLPVGPYYAATKFTLGAGMDPATASLFLSVAADNDVTVVLNGHTEYTLSTTFG
jgi:hypothetical protein